MNDDTQAPQISSLKLMKMSKGYQWEIKIYDNDLEKAKFKMIELNDWFRREYGGDNQNVGL